jgi:hypothetical protein
MTVTIKNGTAPFNIFTPDFKNNACQTSIACINLTVWLNQSDKLKG